MSDKIFDKIFEHSISVDAFLGGITFAAMVVIMQSNNSWALSETLPVYYPELLIGVLGAISFFFIISTIGNLGLLAEGRKISSKFERSIAYFENIGFFALCGFIPALMLPFSLVGAITLAVIEGVSMLLLLRILKK